MKVWMTLTIALVLAGTSTTAEAACRWCQNCQQWHCDQNTNTVSQAGGVSMPQSAPVVQQTNYAPQVQSYSGGSREQQILGLVNQNRARYGLRPLSLVNNLGSQNHAIRMSNANSMFHGRGVTENVAFGNMSPQQVVNMWMNSPGHRRNILGNHSQMDVGNYGRGWVQRFR